MLFNDRREAGRRLAEHLAAALGGAAAADVVVLGLPRGGVPVAYEVARALGAPLDVIIVGKIGAPFQPELALGAVGEGDVRVLNDDLVRRTGLTSDEIADLERIERHELRRRGQAFRAAGERIPIAGRTALIVDDGVATGSTARAACQVARAMGARRVILAAPVGAPEAISSLRRVADTVVCLNAPARFDAVGHWYRDFRPTTDREVIDLLRRAAAPSPAATPAPAAMAGGHPACRDEDVEIAAAAAQLSGHLTLPENPGGVVVFAHGSGSSRHSPRNRHVARILNRAGLGTLLFDLLTPEEEGDRRLVFDIELLARRLVEATEWLAGRAETGSLPLGYFGASTGAAAALWAAADSRVDIRAVVSRGGRPDLAAPRLADVHAPTLLIVGGRDSTVLDLNRRARAAMHCPCDLAVVPGAGHLFEEPGTLDQASALARDWFVAHLPVAPAIGI